MIGIRFKIFEPMMFRSSGEFSPEAKGPFTLAKSLPLPTPSTLAGAIASIFYEEGFLPSGESWYEEFESILGLKNDYMLKGPYLIAKDEKDTRMYVQYFDGLVDIDSLYQRSFIEILRKIMRNSIDTFKELENYQKHLRKLSDYLKDNKKKPKIQSKLGISLDRSKSTIEGLIYSTEMVDYSNFGKECFIAFDATSEISFTKLSGKVTKLGGEGRITQIEIGEPLLTKKIEGIIKGKKFVLYLISPAFFKTTSELKSWSTESNYMFPSPFEHLKQKIEKQSGVDVKTIFGKVSISSAGFKIDPEVKKPIYITLEPGSIIFASGSIPASISEIAQKIGYGVVIPIPLG